MTLEEELARFRATHPAVRTRHAGRAWTYLRGGAGDPVLHLTGILGRAEFGFAQVAALERRFRVIAPDYAPVASLEEAADGVAAVLDAEGVGAAHVVAGSFGGMLAQELVRRDRSRVRSLVLSHTSAPHPDDTGPARAAAALAWLPGWASRALFRRRFAASFAGADPFWLRYFHASTGRLARADLRSRMQVAADFMAPRYAPHDLDAWPGRILILDADHDPLFAGERQRALRVLYPRAALHTFTGTGHAAAILDPKGYAAVILRFLEGESAAG